MIVTGGTITLTSGMVGPLGTFALTPIGLKLPLALEAARSHLFDRMVFRIDSPPSERTVRQSAGQHVVYEVAMNLVEGPPLVARGSALLIPPEVQMRGL